MKLILAFLASLPEILKLIKNIQKAIEEQETQKKVKDDFKKINKAFETRDAKLLNDIFNDVNDGGLRDPKEKGSD